MKSQKQEVKDTVQIPLYQGFRVEADIVPLITTLTGSETYSYEAAIQFNLKKKYFPVAETGFGGGSHSSLSGIGFKGNGMFYRLGLDFNLMKSKPGSKPTNNLFLVGARLGYSGIEYDLKNIELPGNYWGNIGTKDLMGLTDNRFWYELVASLRVEISPNIFIGWNIRTKNLITKDVSGAYKAWYIPGYGISNENAVGFNYMIGYKF